MRLYNTLTRRKEDFLPQGDTVKMYVCGVTPYDQCHVGHAMSYIIFDVLRRYLEWRGYKVSHVQNFTDVDDKLIQRASQKGVSVKELADGLIGEYFEDMDALNVQRAHKYPRATEEVSQILEMVSGLVQRGYAYATDGNVYYRVTRKPDYGKLSHRSLEGVMSGSRVEVDQRKEHPMDFVLWKGSKPGEPSWDSPWGPGRPGWHMECSAMSLKYLGETLDIHGGGMDLIFPHHENEIAQTEAFTGTAPSVRCWLHHGLLQFGEEKMSKSLGNLVTVKEALAQYSPDAIRLFVLGSHYRSPLTYSDESLQAMERGAARLRNAVGQIDAGKGGGALLSPGDYRQRFVEAMGDDLNTPQAIAALFDLAKEVNRGRDEGADVGEAVEALRELSGVLGLTLKERVQPLDPRLFKELLKSLGREMKAAGVPAPGDSDSRAERIIEGLVSARAELRKSRRFALADRIREGLSRLGIALEDTPRGTIWKRD